MERQGKKEEHVSERNRKRGWSMGRMGRWFFFMLMIGQSLPGVNAASDTAQNRGEKTEVSQGKSKTMESSWVGDTRKFQQQEGRRRNEMQKDSNMVRCT